MEVLEAEEAVEVSAVAREAVEVSAVAQEAASAVAQEVVLVRLAAVLAPLEEVSARLVLEAHGVWEDLPCSGTSGVVDGVAAGVVVGVVVLEAA